MHTRNWIALTLCTAAIAWPLAGAALASKEPTDTGHDRVAQAATAAAKEAVRDTYDLKVVDEIPKVLKQVPPQYPDTARKRGQQGKVQVRALVKKDGIPVEVAVVAGKGVSPELDKAAVDAVSQWVFVPAQLKGKPVAVWVIIPLNFKLK